MFFHWLLASFLFRLSEFLVTIFVYEVLRYLVINKVKQLGAKIKGWFTKKK